MAWRDRLRRRAAGADAAGRPRRTEGSGAGGGGRSGSSGSSGSAPSPSGDGGGTSGASGSSMPGDWDGGWRRTAPPPLTVARAPLGVSDGLTFRAGLASWQNPSFDNGLGHALLPTAPTGLVRGVTRPAAPRPARTGGGPLLLRAVRPEGADGVSGGASDAGNAGTSGAGATPVARRVRPGAGSAAGSAASGSSGSGPGASGTTSRSAGAPRSRGITSADSPAVLSSSAPDVQRAVEPVTAPVVTPTDTGRSAVAREIPLIRRVTVVPGATADAAVGRTGVSRSDSRSATRSPGGSGGRTTSGPAVQRAATGARSEVSPAPGAVAPQVVVQLRPVGPRLTAARRQSGPVRRVRALRPAAPPAPGNRPASDASGASSAPAAGTTAPVQRAAARTGSRAPLGAPLSELPSTATPLTEGTPTSRPAPGPALPVVQRQTEGGGASEGGVRGTAQKGPALQEGPAPRRTSDAGRPGARARGGLGAPLPALPPSADVPRSASPGARASRPAPASGPDIQRAPARQDDRSSATAPDRDRTPTATAPPARGEGGADAPLLGSDDVQRRVTNPSAPVDPTSPGRPTDRAGGPATPLVTPSAATASEGPVSATAPAGSAPRPGAQTPSIPGAPGPVVVARALAEGTPDARTPATDQPTAPAAPRAARTSGTAGPGPLPVTGSAAPSVQAAPRTQGTTGTARTSRAAGPGPLPVTGSAAPSVQAAPRTQGTTGTARNPGAADPRPLTGTAASSAPAVPLTLQLLPARPLTLSTRAPEGAAQPTAARSGNRPVVPMRWPGAPAAPRGQGGTGTPARPSPGPSAATQATPHVQRSAAPGPGPAAPQVQRAATPYPGARNSVVSTPGSSAAVQRVPVVQLAPPHRETHGAPSSAVHAPARSLPVTAPQTPPLTDRPSPTHGPDPASAGPVPVVRPRAATPGGGTRGAATPVQRAPHSADDSALPGSMDKALPTPRRQPVSAAGDLAETVKSGQSSGRSRTVSAGSAVGGTASAKRTAHRAETPQDPGMDLDELARRLIDPVARLLRTELRRGRERTGRPYDGRR